MVSKVGGIQMICDIRMHVERKIGDVWERVSEEHGIRHPYWEEAMSEATKAFFNKKGWSPGRNYALFGLLAGVRSTIFSPFIEPRGLPEDLSASVQEIWKDSDGHTPSYLTLPELLSFQNVVEDIPCFLDIPLFKQFKKSGKVPEGYFHAPPTGV